MRFASCRHDGEEFAAVIDDDLAIPIDGIAELGEHSPIELLSNPPLRRDKAVPVAGVELRPVIPRPGKIICVGLNYLSHVGETGRDLPVYPVLFTKFSEALVGPTDPIVLPPESHQVDFEGELAVIIGRAGRRIAVDRALDHVAGYSVANDVTMRDYQYKTHQWLQGKSWESSTPLGPWLVTSDEVGDPQSLSLNLSINGEQMQSSGTDLMIFDVATLISHISEFVTLSVGDVLLSGTPGGVGFRRDPQVFLRDGDVVRAEIVGVGEIENRVVSEHGLPIPEATT
jgi:acylpyruvate hydrolase